MAPSTSVLAPGQNVACRSVGAHPTLGAKVEMSDVCMGERVIHSQCELKRSNTQRKQY